ncbi:hypothetical protein [Mucilaginibacter sp. OK283]|jgi:hypothetical protein|uniref:hypothetical protein n=1 Tax=Mucilaginibacter sp. OK283 TaxID=1881049 RepID=UPI0008CEAC73|nr:hypothetical protein [Mucilaginibacter sp. OK283]SEO79228.1 hypothetical protein SAMN05428947_10499 [Mucilaginibacter sp. OK283]
MSSIHAVTLKSIAKSIYEDWSLDDWLQWPPDAFALFGTIINKTGLYKLCLLDPDWWNTDDWHDVIDDLSNLWVKSASNLLLGKKDYTALKDKEPFKAHFIEIQKDWDRKKAFDINHFRVLSNLYKANPTQEQEDAKKLAKALLYVYIVADVSCAGLGFLGQPLDKDDFSHRIFMSVANLLLNNTGSLSTINKFHGLVLPKMRTPQSGMVSRSLTHHLTFHTTEVEVIWRTFPKLEEGNQSLNILAVPYPYHIDPTDFEIVPDNHQYVRYFRGNILGKGNDDIFLSRLVKKVVQYAKEQNDIDILVLPETALSEKQYQNMLEKFVKAFEEEKKCKRLPIIVVGIMKKNSKTTGYPGVDETFHNEARMGAFFAGTWYTTTQRKHHRWQLNTSQIEQYQLESHLDVNRLWFEYSSIAQRRLTILAPNGWLAMTTLICEDLARQEPVSEVIQGIGPTLLMALLSDGPQLPNRWSARYANILADDPGTAVLSLTSSGMANRSVIPPDAVVTDTGLVVGLWKDVIGGLTKLPLEETNHALFFTVSSTFKNEYTLDGRSDGGFASVFQLDKASIRQVAFDEYASAPLDTIDLNSDLGSHEDDWYNIRELSALQFAVDGLLDIWGDNPKLDKAKYNSNPLKDKKESAELILTLLKGEDPAKTPSRKFRERIILNITEAWKDPALLGIGASAGIDSLTKMGPAIKILEKIIAIDIDKPFNDAASLYINLVNRCKEMLNDQKRNLTGDQTLMSILYNLYNRVSNWQTSRDDGFEISGLTESLAKGIKQEINDIILL